MIARARYLPEVQATDFTTLLSGYSYAKLTLIIVGVLVNKIFL